jgi:hypothetical protein
MDAKVFITLILVKLLLQGEIYNILSLYNYRCILLYHLCTWGRYSVYCFDLKNMYCFVF